MALWENSVYSCIVFLMGGIWRCIRRCISNESLTRIWALTQDPACTLADSQWWHHYGGPGLLHYSLAKLLLVVHGTEMNLRVCKSQSAIFCPFSFSSLTGHGAYRVRIQVLVMITEYSSILTVHSGDMHGGCPLKLIRISQNLKSKTQLRQRFKPKRQKTGKKDWNVDTRLRLNHMYTRAGTKNQDDQPMTPSKGDESCMCV